MMGGAGSGKSEFAVQKIRERMKYERGHRFLIVRKVATTLRSSCFDNIVRQINKYDKLDEWSINATDMRIKYNPNGNMILFGGLDDVEKLKSIDEITGVWIEEASELDEKDLTQLDIRLRGKTDTYLQMIVTFNPVVITHWLKRRFFDEKPKSCTVHHSTYKDNRFLPDDYGENLEKYKEIDPYYYAVYALGEWGVMGNSIFAANKVHERLSKITPPLEEGQFHLGIWLNINGGAIKIYKQPVPGVPYVLGGDTAGEGSDYFTAQVIDNVTGEQVAVLKQQYDEDLYAEQIYHLGKMYNTAMIALEVNFSSFPVKKLTEMNYPNMYVRERVDTFTGQLEKAFGFRTTSKTRPLVIANLVEFVREHVDVINDFDTLQEMLTFVRTEKKPQGAAMDGSHDDLVMGLAIAHGVREQAPKKARVLGKDGKVKKVKWHPDQVADYFAANKADRERMIEMWGVPKFD